MDILKHLVDQCGQAEIMVLRDEKTLVEFEANQLKTCTVAETKGVAVRVISAGKQGFAASSDARSLERLASNALDSASYGDTAAFSFAAPVEARAIRTYDGTVAELSIERLVSMGRELADIVLAVEPDARCKIAISRSVVDKNIRNHRGLNVECRSSPLSIYMGVDRIEGDDMLIISDQLGTTVWDDDYLALARRLAEKLRLSRRTASVKPGRMPVLFSPVGALALSMPLCEGLNGKEVCKGNSPIANKVGERLFDPRISIVDDGTMNGRFASSAYDDEGVPRRRNALIENGRLMGFIYDLKTAAESGIESTGNASRGLFSPANPAFTNLCIEPGETPLAEIIAGMDEGIIVEDVLGLGMGNTISGVFSNPVALAFKVEHGEIVGRAKGLSIAGNVYELLKELGAISRESEWVYGANQAPYILIPDMSVAGGDGAGS